MAVTVRGGAADYWGGSTYTFMRGTSPLIKRIARLFDRKELRDERRLLRTLNGVVAGSTATETLRRVTAVGGAEQGGKRTTEAESLVNRATVAGDVTSLNTAFLTYASRPTYPTDKASRW